MTYEYDQVLTSTEIYTLQDSSGAPGRLSRTHFQAVADIVTARLAVVSVAATEWCHGEATSDQAMSAVLAAVGCQTCGSEKSR